MTDEMSAKALMHSGTRFRLEKKPCALTEITPPSPTGGIMLCGG